MNPKVSIVILNWNGEKLLQQFLPSVISNSRQDNVSIIIADNSSDDNSLEIIQQKFPEVLAIPLNKNYGFANGYNIALQQIKSDYYILLNSDVEVTPGWINPLISIMERDSSVAAVQPKIKSWHKKDEFEYGGAAGGFIDMFGYPFCRGRILNVLEKDHGQYDGETVVFWVSGACMAIRTSAFYEAGGFDSSFWAHMEEIDLCWRLNNKGLKVMCTSQSVVYHLGGGTLSYEDPRKLFLNFRNSLFMLYKNLYPGKFYFTMFCRTFLDGVAALKLLSEDNYGAFKSVLRAHIDFYRSLRTLRKKRRALKHTRIRLPKDIFPTRSIAWQFYIKKKRAYSELLKKSSL